MIVSREDFHEYSVRMPSTLDELLAAQSTETRVELPRLEVSLDTIFTLQDAVEAAMKEFKKVLPATSGRSIHDFAEEGIYDEKKW